MQKNIKRNKTITLFKVYMGKNITNPLKEGLFSGYIGQGKKVEKFEKKIATFIKNPYLLTTNSGTSAIQLALRLANVGYNDEVISTPMTCVATNWPILAQGAKIVWADIDPTSGNIDPHSIKKAITKKTKAILVVDWGGYPCDMDEIKKIAHGIPVIEDAAHAFGSVYKNRMIGQTADFTCFSFQAIKQLTTIDGGALAVKKKNDYQRGKLLRWYGIDRDQRSQYDRIEIDVNEWGYKFHMNDVSAIIGLENFKSIKHILKQQRDNAFFYRNELDDLHSIKLLREDKNYCSTYWLFTLLVKNRKQFLTYMRTKNIMVSQVHRRNDTHPVVSNFKKLLSGVDTFANEMICIPVGWWLSQYERKYIVDSIKSFDKIVSR